MSRIPLALCNSEGIRTTTIGIGLLGCGIVGSGVARALLEPASRSSLAGASLLRIGVRDPAKARPGVNWQRYEDDLFAIVDDPDVRIVVECIGGTGLARELVTRAIARGKHVVTANKDVIATEGPWLSEFAQRTGGSLRFEAAVGGAIPIVRALTESLAAEDVVEVGGVLNGTTNFVLGKMEGGASYAGALAEAQRLGFAESDPSADVDGHDAAHKLAILARLAFRQPLTSTTLERRGIGTIDASDVQFAAAHDAVIKLIAVARRDMAGGIAAGVTPAVVARTHAFAGPSGAGNCVRVVGRRSGALTFAGTGAGGDATASAVVGDLCAAIDGLRGGRREVLDGAAAAPPYRRLRLDRLLHVGAAAASAAERVAGGLGLRSTVLAQNALVVRTGAGDEGLDAALRSAGIRARSLPLWDDAA